MTGECGIRGATSLSYTTRFHLYPAFRIPIQSVRLNSHVAAVMHTTVNTERKSRS